MAEKLKTRLRNLQINRVDLVDHGAALDPTTGEGAYVLLMKRAEEGELVDIGKPYPNEHAARMKSPDGYKRMRRQNDKFGPGIHAIFGVTDEDKTELQAVRFDREKFTAAEAKVWLKEHDMKPAGFEPATEKTIAEKSDYTGLAGTWEELQAQLYAALKAKLVTSNKGYVSIIGTFDDQVVVCVYQENQEGQTYRLGWTRLDGKVELGEPEKVEVKQEVKVVAKFRAEAIRAAEERRYKKMLDKETVVKRLSEIEGTEDITAFIEELHAKANPVTPTKPEDVFKSLPQEIRTRIEKAESDAAAAQTLAKRLQDEKELGEMVAVCKAWSSISVDLATLPAHLLTVKRIDPAAYEAVSKQIDAANAASKLTKEIGRAGEESSGDGTAVGEVRKLAEALVAKDAKITHDEAVDLVFRDHPDLYKRYRAETAVHA